VEDMVDTQHMALLDIMVSNVVMAESQEVKAELLSQDRFLRGSWGEYRGNSAQTNVLVE